LTLFGLVMVLSASSVASLHRWTESPFGQFRKQLIWAGLGSVGFIVGARMDYHRLRRVAGPAMFATIVLLVAVLVPGIGKTVNGSQRWIDIGGFVLQPSELAKLAMVVFIADLLARRERRMDRPELTIRPVMLVLCVLSALIVVQPKLGTPLVLAAVACLMLFVAGARLPSLAAWTVSLAALGTVAAFAESYRKDRLTSFLDPWANVDNTGFQIIQSRVGIASGGVGGVGLGASRAKWGFLPEAHSDFIFAIVAEEVGLLGASAVILAFVLIALFGVRAALGAPDRFGMLLAAGITIWLVFQAFLNIGIVIGVLPTTGEPLPFVSYGGSSLITALTAAGLLTGVARRSVEPS
jgi:cell division protein FtsW